ncbi:hypothetical protein BO443_10441 [Burkholderia orbicola]
MRAQAFLVIECPRIRALPAAPKRAGEQRELLGVGGRAVKGGDGTETGQQRADTDGAGRAGHRGTGRHGSLSSHDNTRTFSCAGKHVSTRLGAITYYTYRDNMRVRWLVLVTGGTRVGRVVCGKRNASCCLVMEGTEKRNPRAACRLSFGTRKKTRPGRPREYSQTPSDEGNKQL